MSDGVITSDGMFRRPLEWRKRCRPQGARLATREARRANGRAATTSRREHFDETETSIDEFFGSYASLNERDYALCGPSRVREIVRSGPDLSNPLLPSLEAPPTGRPR